MNAVIVRGSKFVYIHSCYFKKALHLSNLFWQKLSNMVKHNSCAEFWDLVNFLWYLEMYKVNQLSIIKGPFKYYVIMILTFFDPPTLSADVIISYSHLKHDVIHPPTYL